MADLVLVEGALRAWFPQLHACIQAVDYDQAEHHFAPDVMGFETYKDIAVGREALRREQWFNIWPTVPDFTFRLEQMHWSTQGTLAWAACPWDSVVSNADGTPFPRPGRVTVIFQCREGTWLAVHTHFSLNPNKA